MNNLQTTTKPNSSKGVSKEKLANTAATLVKSGFDDNDFLKLSKMLLLRLTPKGNPDAVYYKYPALTQFVTENLPGEEVENLFTDFEATV